MKKSKFTDSQIMDALKRAESGLAVPEICREMGVSTENARLRKMYVEEKIKAEIVAEALAKQD